MTPLHGEDGGEGYEGTILSLLMHLVQLDAAFTTPHSSHSQLRHAAIPIILSPHLNLAYSSRLSIAASTLRICPSIRSINQINHQPHLSTKLTSATPSPLIQKGKEQELLTTAIVPFRVSNQSSNSTTIIIIPSTGYPKSRSST